MAAVVAGDTAGPSLLGGIVAGLLPAEVERDRRQWEELGLLDVDALPHLPDDMFSDALPVRPLDALTVELRQLRFQPT